MNSYTFLLSDVTKSRALAYMTLLQSQGNCTTVSVRNGSLVSH